MKKVRWFLLAVALTLAFTGLAQADSPLTVGGGWQEFSFGDVGSAFSPQPWTFHLDTAGLLKVTDAYLSGDRFEVFDFGSSLGLTSLPGSTGDQIGSDYDAAAADSRWSTGFYSLGIGDHSITGTVTLSPYSGGGAALRADVVPIPGALWLLGSGLLGMAGWRRFRKI
jgi:hypothetical protein